MKRLLGAAALSAGLLILTGCAGSPSASTPTTAGPTPSTVTQTVTITPTPSATAIPVLSRDERINQIYLESIRKDQPGLKAAADADLVDIGKGYCRMYDGGAKGSDINKYILTAAGWAYTVPQLVSMHASAVGAFCPQHIEKMGS